MNRQDLTLPTLTCKVYARSAAHIEATRSEPCSSESPFCMGEERRICRATRSDFKS